MNNILIRTDNDNEYLYSFNKESFYFLHPEMKLKNEHDINDEYYKRKISFWKQKGVFDDIEPKFETNVDPENIRRSFANIRQIVIEVTDDCNLACSYCVYGQFYDNYDKRTGKKQTFENVCILLDYLIDLWTSDLNLSFENIIYISFYGGEPLLNISLIKKTVSYLNNLNLKYLKFVYAMTTNAVLLYKYMDFIVQNKFNLLVSLDGNKDQNVNRITKKGIDSFDIIFENLKIFQLKYPDYFSNHVNFNAVLNKNNNVKDIMLFFKNNFNKYPRISELSTNGLLDEKRKYFFDNVYKNRQNEQYLEPNDYLYTSYINDYCGNRITSYLELFETNNNKRFIPTGSCYPFSRKIFLTVNGKILPCERIGQKFSLGSIQKQHLIIDFLFVSMIYSNMYKKVVEKCIECAFGKSCKQCIWFNDLHNDSVKCSAFTSWHDLNKYFNKLISYVENTR